MTEREHKLILEYNNGGIQARCSCGCWGKDPVSIRAQRLRDVYGRLEEEHWRHVEEVASQEPAPV